MATAIALYSTSADERDTTVYFFDLHNIKDSPKKMQKPVMDLLVSGHPAQSESQKPFNCKSVADGKNSPCPSVPFKYWKTLWQHANVEA